MIQNMTLILIGSFKVFSFSLASGERSLFIFWGCFTNYYSLFFKSELKGDSNYFLLGFFYGIKFSAVYLLSEMNTISSLLGVAGACFFSFGWATLETGITLVSSLKILFILGRKLGRRETSFLLWAACMDWSFMFGDSWTYWSSWFLSFWKDLSPLTAWPIWT